MKLDTIATDPTASLIAMERYVNDGSPSGFSFAYTTSRETSPRLGVRSFRLGVALAADTDVLTLGVVPPSLFVNSPDEAIFVHPDMVDHQVLRRLAVLNETPSFFEVQPTASARTVWVTDPDINGFLKLHYDAHIGRILRQITVRHAQAAIHTDTILLELVERGSVPHSFAFFRETGARVFHKRRDDEELFWGMMWRPGAVCGARSALIQYVVPAFSLFSRDIQQPSDETILAQLGAIHRSDRLEYLLHEFLLPLIDAYFALLEKGGLQGEWHAQNVLFGFDEHWRCVATILRDLESVDRDLPFMERAGFRIPPPGYPYKCFARDDAVYTVRHSFMFDHKFGEYLLAPLIDHACELWDIRCADVDRRVTQQIARYLQHLPATFFPPDRSWYKFEDQLIDQSVRERPYVQRRDARFRPERGDG